MRILWYITWWTVVGNVCVELSNYYSISLSGLPIHESHGSDWYRGPCVAGKLIDGVCFGVVASSALYLSKYYLVGWSFAWKHA